MISAIAMGSTLPASTQVVGAVDVGDDRRRHVDADHQSFSARVDRTRPPPGLPAGHGARLDALGEVPCRGRGRRRRRIGPRPPPRSALHRAGIEPRQVAGADDDVTVRRSQASRIPATPAAAARVGDDRQPERANASASPPWQTTGSASAFSQRRRHADAIATPSTSTFRRRPSGRPPPPARTTPAADGDPELSPGAPEGSSCSRNCSAALGFANPLISAAIEPSPASAETRGCWSVPAHVAGSAPTAGACRGRGGSRRGRRRSARSRRPRSPAWPIPRESAGWRPRPRRPRRVGSSAASACSKAARSAGGAPAGRSTGARPTSRSVAAQADRSHLTRGWWRRAAGPNVGARAAASPLDPSGRTGPFRSPTGGADGRNRSPMPPRWVGPFMPTLERAFDTTTGTLTGSWALPSSAG